MKQYICVTGGAGGIGSAVVRRYAALPETIVLVVDTNEFGDNSFKNVESFVVDITDGKNIEKLAKKLQKKDIHITHLICVAGGGSGEMAKLSTISDNAIENSVQLNLTSQIFLVKHLMTDSISERDRSIVFISSINAIKSYGLTAYSAAKAGLLGLTRELAGSLAPHVRVNVVLPGTVPTPRTMREPKDFEAYKNKTLLGKFASPEDIAAACYFFTHMTNVVTGAEIVVDAGQSISTK